ncbi:MAG: flagellar export chaperone FliS [Planctomycetota bacterium]
MSYANPSRPTGGVKNANSYLRTRVMSASPEELRLMLLEGAARFARQGHDGLVVRDYEQSYEGFTQARNIIIELITTMNEDAAPELCQRVRSLYTFIYSELVSASFEKDASRAASAIKLIDYEIETWKLLMNDLAENESQDRAAQAPASTPEDPDGSQRPRLSITG